MNALNSSEYTDIYIDAISSNSSDLRGLLPSIERFFVGVSNRLQDAEFTRKVDDFLRACKELASSKYPARLPLVLRDERRGLFGDIADSASSFGLGNFLKNPLDGARSVLSGVGTSAIFKEEEIEELALEEKFLNLSIKKYLTYLPELISSSAQTEDETILQSIIDNENLIEYLVEIGDYYDYGNKVIYHIISSAGIKDLVTDEQRQEKLEREMRIKENVEQNIFARIGFPPPSTIKVSNVVVRGVAENSKLKLDIPVYAPKDGGYTIMSSSLLNFIRIDLEEALNFGEKDKSKMQLRKDFYKHPLTSVLIDGVNAQIQNLEYSMGESVARDLPTAYESIYAYGQQLPSQTNRSFLICLMHIVSSSLKEKLKSIYDGDTGFLSPLNKVTKHMQKIKERESLNKLSFSENNLVKNQNSINNKDENMKNKNIFSDQLKKDAILGRQPDQPLSEFYKALGQEYGNDIVPRDTRENLYGHKGEDLIAKSHPQKVIVSDSIKDGGLVENGHEQKEKSLQVAKKNPTGNFVGNYAWMRDYIKKQS